jgi:predicted dehydrogenase
VIGDHPEVRQAIEWIRRGAISSVSMVRARASHPGPAWFPDFTTDPTWFYEPGSGPVLDVAVYPLQVLCLMLGPVRRVTALAATSHPRRDIRSGPMKGGVVNVTTPDNVHMVLDFGGERLATLDATWNTLSSRGPRMEVYGDRGVLNLYSRPEDPPYELFIDDQATGVRGWLQPEASYRGALMPVLGGAPTRRWTFIDGLEDVARSIAAGVSPTPSAELARHVLDICLSVLESAESGRVVELSTTFSTEGGPA